MGTPHAMWYDQIHPEHPFLKLVHAADAELVQLVNKKTKNALLLYRRQECKSAPDFFTNMQIDHDPFKKWWEGEPAQVKETTTLLRERLKVISARLTRFPHMRKENKV